MLYKIPVQIRVVGFGDCWSYNVSEVLKCGKLWDRDGTGFYLLVREGDKPTDAKMGGMAAARLSANIVVKAANIYEAIGKYYQHPGVVGTGREEPGGERTENGSWKAIWRESNDWDDIVEFPDCDLDEAFSGGCFSVSDQGWARCKYVAGEQMNKEQGYCHCCLQVNEAPTGCLTEAYSEELAIKERPAVTIPVIRYRPIDPELLRRVEAEY
jgi:hypothetical protein